MKHLTGKKLNITCTSGKSIIGLCTGATDEIIKILLDKETDETIVFIKNIFSYTIIGGKTTGGYSGLKVFICKNDILSCKGIIRLSKDNLTIDDMECPIHVAKKKVGEDFKCDFACLGAMEVLPSPVQAIFFEGMKVNKNGGKAQ